VSASRRHSALMYRSGRGSGGGQSSSPSAPPRPRASLSRCRGRYVGGGGGESRGCNHALGVATCANGVSWGISPVPLARGQSLTDSPGAGTGMTGYPRASHAWLNRNIEHPVVDAARPPGLRYDAHETIAPAHAAGVSLLSRWGVTSARRWVPPDGLTPAGNDLLRLEGWCNLQARASRGQPAGEPSTPISLFPTLTVCGLAYERHLPYVGNQGRIRRSIDDTRGDDTGAES
jgi:hypothetical protein